MSTFKETTQIAQNALKLKFLSNFPFTQVKVTVDDIGNDFRISIVDKFLTWLGLNNLIAGESILKSELRVLYQGLKATIYRNNATSMPKSLNQLLIDETFNNTYGKIYKYNFNSDEIDIDTKMDQLNLLLNSDPIKKFLQAQPIEIKIEPDNLSLNTNDEEEKKQTETVLNTSDEPIKNTNILQGYVSYEEIQIKTTMEEIIKRAGLVQKPSEIFGLEELYYIENQKRIEITDNSQEQTKLILDLEKMREKVNNSYKREYVKLYHLANEYQKFEDINFNVINPLITKENAVRIAYAKSQRSYEMLMNIIKQKHPFFKI